ncbi:MAG TPA: winged helix-turn-helix domain-containing protein [Bacteriovoracaceae bacterium]|nr:winged helix-turn-helix domain-containing protein [Bacteriovoracaceae bacterium]
MDTIQTRTEESPSIETLMSRAVVDLTKDDRFLSHLPTDSSRIEGQGHYRLAKIFYDKADFEKAEEHFLHAVAKTEMPQDAFVIFKIYGFLIRIYSESLNEREANKYIQLSSDLIDQTVASLPSLTAEYFYNVAVVNTYRGEFSEAQKNFVQAYRKAQTENEPELMAKSLYAMATNAYQMKNFSDAIVHLSQLNELLNILKKGYLKGSMHLLWGNVLREQGEYANSLPQYDLAMKLLHSKRCWNMHNYVLMNKGVALKKMGEFSKALMLFGIAQNSLDEQYFKRLQQLILMEVEDVNDSSVDLYLDRHNRVIHEKALGVIDFKHRFVLLEILFLLAQTPGTYYNKEDLAKMIWKDEYNPLIHDKLIYTSISRLRKLIEPKGIKRQYILRGKDGYTFNPRVNARFHKENEVVKQKNIGNIEISSPV